MKPLTTVAIVLLLAGCNAVLPSRTFTGGGIVCSRGEGQIEVDADIFDAFADMSLWREKSYENEHGKTTHVAPPTAEELALLMLACRDLLKVFPPWTQAHQIP